MSDMYNLVQIGTVYLTDDGLVSGNPCRTLIDNLDLLQSAYIGQTFKAADGSPYNTVYENTGAGVDLVIKPFAAQKSVLDAIVAVNDAAILANSAVVVVITGLAGNFTLHCIPTFPRSVAFQGQEYIDDRIADATITYSVIDGL